MKTKTFDCIKMKEEGAAAVREKLKGMSMEEELEYWRKGHEELLTLQKQLQEKRRLENEKAGVSGN